MCIDAVATASSLRSDTQPGSRFPSRRDPAPRHWWLRPQELAINPARAAGGRYRCARSSQNSDQGYAVSHGERVLGVSAVSAPIKGVDEQVHYCLSVAGPTVRVQGREHEFIKQSSKPRLTFLANTAGRGRNARWATPVTLGAPPSQAMFSRRPPSISKETPVTKFASSDAR